MEYCQQVKRTSIEIMMNVKLCETMLNMNPIGNKQDQPSKIRFHSIPFKEPLKTKFTWHQKVQTKDENNRLNCFWISSHCPIVCILVLFVVVFISDAKCVCVVYDCISPVIRILIHRNWTKIGEKQTDKQNNERTQACLCVCVCNMMRLINSLSLSLAARFGVRCVCGRLITFRLNVNEYIRMRQERCKLIDTHTQHGSVVEI